MARFILFGGETYYAKGGAHDIVNSFGSLVEAKAYGEALLVHPSCRHDWYHVFDIGTQSIVLRSPTQAHGAPYEGGEDDAV